MRQVKVSIKDPNGTFLADTITEINKQSAENIKLQGIIFLVLLFLEVMSSVASCNKLNDRLSTVENRLDLLNRKIQDNYVKQVEQHTDLYTYIVKLDHDMEVLKLNISEASKTWTTQEK